MIEACLRAQLLTLSAVTALVGSGASARIRPYRLWQKDDISAGAALIVRVNRDEPQNDLTHRGGVVISDVSIIACAETIEQARALAEAVRANGTDPGTGMAGSEFVAAGVTVESCCLTFSEPDFVPYGDDSDEGFFVVEAHYSVIYGEVM